MGSKLLLAAFGVLTFLLCSNLGQADFRANHACDISGESKEDCDLKDPEFILYLDPDNPDNNHKLVASKSSIDQANPHKNAVWKILIHGFISNQNSPFPVNVRNAYLNRTNRTGIKYNVLVFDWGNGACASLDNTQRYLYDYAAHNVIHYGRKLGEFLIFMHNNNYLDINKDVHIIGFSLGAHVAGQAGLRIYDKLGPVTLRRISGLDPAGPAFWAWKFVPSFLIPNRRLHRKDTQFLDVYHTSKLFGSDDKMGDIDFTINGGQSQPDCVPTKLNLLFRDLVQTCSHNMVTELFAKSINDNSLRGCMCPSYSSYKIGSCKCDESAVFGEFVDNSTKTVGEFYIETPREDNSIRGFISGWWHQSFKDMMKNWWGILC